MRIDLYGATAAAIPEGRVSIGSSSGAQLLTPPEPEDTTTLSSGSVSASSLVTQALRVAEAREGKVEALRQAVSSGAYTLDPGLIAQAMLSSGI